ncbi:MAG: ATP synthase F0 subunit C [Elusimicrobia bacterium]|nr:ATP synthase F0 subunit C [Elusimicrobiota bacterium]
MLYLGLGYLGAGLGAGLCLLGAAFGIARLASAALEGTARQPEAAGALRTSMIIPAALIEGLGFFGLVICLLVALNLGLPKSSGTQGHAASAVEENR